MNFNLLFYKRVLLKKMLRGTFSLRLSTSRLMDINFTVWKICGCEPQHLYLLKNKNVYCNKNTSICGVDFM